MKTFIIAAVTADGYIARDSKHASIEWTSKADKKQFVELTKQAGVVVMGSATYKTIGRPLPGRTTIVYSNTSTFEGVETTQLPPRVLLASLEARGFTSVAICGGSRIYSMFMKAGVIDTIHLTIEPIIFGKGVPLFNEDMSIYHLQLKNVQQSESTGTLLVEYSVDHSGTAK